jgi:hypothetical protein
MITEHKWTIVDIASDKWVFIYNDDTNELLTEPFQCGGSYTCQDTVVVADTLEECRQCITDKQLKNQFEESDATYTDDL